MGDVISFRIDLDPKPSNQRRAAMVRGHARVVQDAAVVNHQAAISLLSAQHAPREPFTGALQVIVVCVMPRPKSLAKKWGACRYEHVGRPDADNLAKSVLDGLGQSGRWWRDDSQVCVLRIDKLIAATDETPHYRVEVHEIVPRKDLP